MEPFLIRINNRDVLVTNFIYMDTVRRESVDCSNYSSEKKDKNARQTTDDINKLLTKTEFFNLGARPKNTFRTTNLVNGGVKLLEDIIRQENN